jgi:hypothetical protein
MRKEKSVSIFGSQALYASRVLPPASWFLSFASCLLPLLFDFSPVNIDFSLRLA